METPSEWSCFYQTLNRLGPRLLKGVHPELEAWINFQASESDEFWSEGLHGDFDLWKEGRREEAVKVGLENWYFNVKKHLREDPRNGLSDSFRFDRYHSEEEKQIESVD